MAKTYGKLPSELLKLSWTEYQFCVAVLLASLDEDGGGKGSTAASGVLSKFVT